ncbi:hypothetical protein I4U23_023939 [Adineta vaga]|nr:hypothetical protein I4U23_023939 [Adineta vaga]
MENVDSDQSHFLASMISDGSTSHTSSNLEQQLQSLSIEPQSNVIDLEDNTSNDNYPSSNNVCESEDDSDTHDQPPTEATDDSILPNGSLVDSDEKTIDISFQPQPSQDRDDDIRSPVEETDPCQSNFSSVVAEIDDICDTKPTESSSVVYKQSLCVPCTVEKDDIATIKETLTTTTTTLTTEYTELKKDKNDLGHIMISYNHSTKVLCSKIARGLKDRNYIVWIDQDNISGDILTSMASAVENAFVVLMAINDQYYKSRYCRLEAEYSLERNKASIPMLMERDYKASGWLGIINGSKLHIDFSQLSFDEAFQLLIREIETIRISLGADGNHRHISVDTSFNSTRAITTVNNSWHHFQDVNEWNANDVVEWLDREKLEIFENALMNFNGTTLWQLYKIKFDSPTDYYRVVESLLPSTVPLRLFYNLSFNGAIESLFSSFNHRKH